MANSLTDRQNKILKAIIDEYVETATAVGSETLERKYNLGVSPATLRIEMVRLTKEGYLHQPHTSSGRLPTPTAMKYYVDYLMKQKDLSVSEEVAVKEKLWENRQALEKMMTEATRELAHRTGGLAIACDNQNNAYYAGVANILKYQEFYDIDLTHSVLSLLDNVDSIHKLILRDIMGDEDVRIMMGTEFGQRFMEPCGLVYTAFGDGKKYSGTIGVLGPYRFNYPVVIPTVRYFGDLIDEILANY